MTTYQAYGGYPPAGNDSSTLYNPANNASKNEQIARDINRTPSPTPSEAAELSHGVFNWRQMGNWRFWIRREWLWYYIGVIILTVIAALIYVYHTQIVDALTPAAEWMRDLKVGFLIPIAVLFVLSFPPLFGHEIVAIICGLVWGIGWGFAIVAAGTFLGEIGNFYAFKYCLRSRAEKLEKTQLSYACLARIIRDGGIWVPLIARLSAIPGHFTTAVFSTCGMSIVVFAISAVLSLPKQFVTVYLGVVLKQADEGVVDTKTKVINYSVIGITTLITVGAMWFIYHKMNKVKPVVIYERRKARQAKMYQNNAFASSASTTSLTDVPLTIPSNSSTLHAEHIPLGPYDPTQKAYDPPAQRWDSAGQAVGYAPDPRLAAPNPRRAQQASFDAYGPYGGPPVGQLTPRDSSPEHMHTSPEPIARTPSAPASNAPPRHRPIVDVASNIPVLPPPPASPRTAHGPASPRVAQGHAPGSPGPTPTQATFGVPPSSATAAWAGGYADPYAQAPVRQHSTGYQAGGYNDPPASFFAAQQAGQAVFAPYQPQPQVARSFSTPSPTVRQPYAAGAGSQPGTPTIPQPGTEFVGFGHVQEGTGSTFYTAAGGHSRAPTDEPHADAYGRVVPPSAGSSMLTNPYAGYASPTGDAHQVPRAGAPPTYGEQAGGYGVAR